MPTPFKTEQAGLAATITTPECSSAWAHRLNVQRSTRSGLSGLTIGAICYARSSQTVTTTSIRKATMLRVGVHGAPRAILSRSSRQLPHAQLPELNRRPFAFQAQVTFGRFDFSAAGDFFAVHP